jgi:2-methylaconitate cis-trans-isomerase PrpF
MSALKCAILRGGTSKAVFIEEAALPADPRARDRVILGVFGSPDRRQIDGLGGADPLTSKLAIIGPPRHPDADLTYTFGQVEIDAPRVDYGSLCGNITAAVGIYAIYAGYVPALAPVARVRVWNSNYQRMLYVEVPVQNGAPLEDGDFVMPGAPGSGAAIVIDFAQTAGAATGALLPTRRMADLLDIEGLGAIEATLVDIGNPHVFVRARDLNLDGAETPAEIDTNPTLLEILERIRGAAAVRMGLAPEANAARATTPAVPIIGLVCAPKAYQTVSGAMIGDVDADVLCRLLFMGQAHKTYAGTSAVCTGVAARLPGTIVNQCVRLQRDGVVRIGHPAGVIETETRLSGEGLDWRVERATLTRTARRILEGTVYVAERAG